MIKLGVVDFDSSHSVEFIRRINHKDIAEEQWVHGAEVIMGCSYPSEVTDDQTVESYVAAAKEMGVEIVESEDDMIGRVEGVLLLSDDGDTHYERALTFIEAGVPMFIDKPLTYSVDQAKDLIETAAEKGVPIFSSSSLRYAPEVVSVAGGEACGGIVSAATFSPAKPQKHHAGLWYYGIHAVETLYALMGPGCEAVRCVSTETSDMVMAEWTDGRLAAVHGMRASTHAFGFTAWGEKGIVQKTVDARYIYRELLKKVIEMFQTGEPPVPPSETLELITFLDAAVRSAREESRRVRLADYDDE